MGAIYSLIGLGYVTIYRTSHIVNMAQGSFVMVGAFFAYSLLTERGLPYWASIILTILAVVVVAVGMYLLVLRPLMKTSFVNMILATVGLSLLVEALVLVKWGDPKGLPSFTGDKMLWIGGVAIAPQNLWVIGLMLVIFVALYFLGSRTRVGKQMTATATNPNAARMSGISTNTHGHPRLRHLIRYRGDRWHGHRFLDTHDLHRGRYLGPQRLCGSHSGRLGFERGRRHRRSDFGSHPVAQHRFHARRIPGRYRLRAADTHPVLPATGASGHDDGGRGAVKSASSVGSRASALMRGRYPALAKTVLVIVLLVWPIAYKNLYAMSVMTTAGLFALLTIAVGIILGQAGQLSFGHSAFYGVGAYVAGLLSLKLGVPTLASLAIGACAAGIVAVIIGRPVLKLRYFYLALATIGLGQIFIVLVSQLRDLTGRHKRVPGRAHAQHLWADGRQLSQTVLRGLGTCPRHPAAGRAGAQV